MPEENPLNEFKGLCQRCEHRVRFLEHGIRPRMECGIVPRECRVCRDKTMQERRACTHCNGSGYSMGMSSGSCYMYRPVRPVVLQRTDPDDPRPMTSGILACRSRGVRLPEMDMKEHLEEDGRLWYWAPKEQDDAEEPV